MFTTPNSNQPLPWDLQHVQTTTRVAWSFQILTIDWTRYRKKKKRKKSPLFQRTFLQQLCPLLKCMPNKDNPLIFWPRLFVKWGKRQTHRECTFLLLCLKLLLPLLVSFLTQTPVFIETTARFKERSLIACCRCESWRWWLRPHNPVPGSPATGHCSSGRSSVVVQSTP